MNQERLSPRSRRWVSRVNRLWAFTTKPKPAYKDSPFRQIKSTPDYCPHCGMNREFMRVVVYNSLMIGILIGIVLLGVFFLLAAHAGLNVGLGP